jgi:hypothetical protein
MGTGSFPGVKQPGSGVDHHPPPPPAEVEGRVELYLYFPSGSSWPVLGRTLPFTFYTQNSMSYTKFKIDGPGVVLASNPEDKNSYMFPHSILITRIIFKIFGRISDNVDVTLTVKLFQCVRTDG